MTPQRQLPVHRRLTRKPWLLNRLVHDHVDRANELLREVSQLDDVLTNWVTYKETFNYLNTLKLIDTIKDRIPVIDIMENLINKSIKVFHKSFEDDTMLNFFIIEAKGDTLGISSGFQVEIEVPTEELKYWSKIVMGCKSFWTDTK